MSGDVLLDTNVVNALFNRDPAVVQRIVAAPTAYLPVIVIGELCFGAQKSAHLATNLQRIGDLISRTNVLPCDQNTAFVYGQLKQQLRAQGTPIPENDLWIAAITQQHGLTLLSRDVHFRQVPGIALESC